MKKTDLSQVKEMDIKSLKEKAKAIKKEVSTLFLDKNMSKLTDLKGLMKKRKELAQVFTILTQKVSVEKLEAKLKKSEVKLEELEAKIEKKGKK